MTEILTGERLGNAVQVFEFVPDRAQQRLKAKIMGIIQDNPIYAMSEITYDMAFMLTKDKRLKTWWQQPGFEDWMRNKDEFKQKLQDLVSLSLETAEQIITSEATPPAARVNMIKLVWEAAAKFPQKVANPNKENTAASHMSPEQLDEMMRKAGYVRISAMQPAQIAQKEEQQDVQEEETEEN
jgi:hypothetical protein